MAHAHDRDDQTRVESAIDELVTRIKQAYGLDQSHRRDE